MLKRVLKRLLRALMIIGVSPLLLLYFLLRLCCQKDSLFAAFSQFLSLIPGLIGSYLRIAFYRCTMAHCAVDSYIGFAALFSQQGTELGADVYIGPQCNIGLCHIGAHTLLGSGVHILSGKNQHNFNDPSRPYKAQGGTFEKVVIGQNCWLGNGAIVMASIGEGTIVGAGSVVTTALPAGVIAVGNPAKIVKHIADVQTEVVGSL